MPAGVVLFRGWRSPLDRLVLRIRLCPSGLLFACWLATIFRMGVAASSMAALARSGLCVGLCPSCRDLRTCAAIAGFVLPRFAGLVWDSAHRAAIAGFRSGSLPVEATIRLWLLSSAWEFAPCGFAYDGLFRICDRSPRRDRLLVADSGSSVA